MKILIYGILFLACCTVCCTGKATEGKERVEKKDSSPEEDSIKVKKVHPDSIGFPRFTIIDKYAPFLYDSLNEKDAIAFWGLPLSLDTFSAANIYRSGLGMKSFKYYSLRIEAKEVTWRLDNENLLTVWYLLKDTVNDIWTPVEHKKWSIHETRFLYYYYYDRLDDDGRKRFSSPEFSEILCELNKKVYDELYKGPKTRIPPKLLRRRVYRNYNNL